LRTSDVIQGLWIGESLSDLERLCVKSFIDNRHDFHLYCYGKVAGVPEGTVLKDANEVYDEDKIWRYSNGSPAGFANNFRYKLLFEKGGWWVDLDSFCYRPFDFDDELVFSSEMVEGVPLINLAAVKVPPGHESMRKALEMGERLGGSNTGFGSTGPYMFSAVIKGLKLEKFVKDPDVFCPVPYERFRTLIDDPAPQLPDKTVSVHFWNEMWRESELDKNGKYFEGSFYETMKRRHLSARRKKRWWQVFTFHKIWREKEGIGKMVLPGV